MEIQPRHLTFADLIDGRLFSVPDYQRNYSWTSRERLELFNDIKNTIGKSNDDSHLWQRSFA